MPCANSMPSEQAAILGIIDPDAYAAGTETTAWADLRKFESLMAVVMVGDMQATSTVDAVIKIATDSSGTNAVAMTGKAITQFTAAGTDSNKQAIMNVRAEEVSGQVTSTLKYTHAALVMTVATAASDAGGVLFGFNPRHGPASDNDIAAVDEIVN